MIHQHFAQSLSMAGGAKKQPADFCADQSNEADRFCFLLQYPGFGIWKVKIAQVFILLRDEAVT